MAIVGLSCRFAGAPNPGALWRLIASRRSALTPLDDETALPPGSANVFERPFPTHAGQLAALYACTPRALTFPRQINAGENQDLYFAVQLAHDALADAAIRPRTTDAMRGSVHLGYAPFFSPSNVNWLEHTFFIDQTMDILGRFFPHAPAESLDHVRTRLVESLPPPDAQAFVSGTGHCMADWIARECAFSGNASAIDAGVLSGASALAAAVDDLACGRADIAIAGAVSPPLSRAALQGLSGCITFSAESSLVPFSRDASGTIPGEGGAFFVLKRRTDALAAHDRIYALVRCCTAGSAGPDDLLAEAASRSAVPISSIRLVEADGNGIPEDDAKEIEAIQRLWGGHKPGGPLVGIGSVKGNIGHCLTASSAAGIMKATLALRARVLAPQVAAARPRSELANISSSAYLLDEPLPWITGDPTSPRRAAVLARDFAGRGAAVILEEEPESRR